MANGFNIKIGSILDTSGAEKSIGKLTKSIQTAVKTSSGELLTKQMNTYVKSVELADGTVKKYTKTFKSLVNSQGQYVDIKGKVLKQQGEELVKQEQTTKAVKSTTQAIKANTDALQAQGEVASKTSNIFSNFGESLAKMAYFKIANEALSLFTTACNEATQAIFDYNAAMTELKKVTSFSEEEYTRLASDLDEISGKVARTRTELTESVTEFAKSGTYTTKELESLAYAATLYQNVADSELSAGDAASYIISQMKAYGIAAEDAMTIIDKTNEV